MKMYKKIIIIIAIISFSNICADIQTRYQELQKLETEVKKIEQEGTKLLELLKAKSADDAVNIVNTYNQLLAALNATTLEAGLQTIQNKENQIASLETQIKEAQNSAEGIEKINAALGVPNADTAIIHITNFNTFLTEHGASNNAITNLPGILESAGKRVKAMYDKIAGLDALNSDNLKNEIGKIENVTSFITKSTIDQLNTSVSFKILDLKKKAFLKEKIFNEVKRPLLVSLDILIDNKNALKANSITIDTYLNNLWSNIPAKIPTETTYTDQEIKDTTLKTMIEEEKTFSPNA